MTRLVLRLLGGYRVELDGEAVYDFATDKARALLAYLAVEADRPHRRETLAGLLWPERADGVARANLRQALSYVRRALLDRQPPLFLFVTPRDVQFNSASDHTLDVAELEAFARAPAGAPARLRQLLPEALCADFLAGFSMPDSEAFQAWVLNQQEHYHRLAIEVLDEQNAYFEGVGDYEQAVAAARLQLRLEPWLEEGHRRCMRALALAGRRDEALRQYELCRRALAAELGAEPAGTTQALHAEIRAGKYPAAAVAHTLPSSPRSPDKAGRAVMPPGQAAPGRQPGQAPALPARPPTMLVAREDELGQLGRYLEAALAGVTGVAFISGDAGSGKTALLEAFAASAMANHPDLLVAGACCSPGGSLDPCLPLRRLSEMLFGDVAAHVTWRIAGLPRDHEEQVDRLQDATGLTLASLAEHGLGLVDTLVPTASITHRAGLRKAEVSSHTTMADDVAAGRPAWREVLLEAATLEKQPKPPAPLAQGALFDQLMWTLAAIARKRPLLLILDDLHWVDDGTAAFLLRIGRELNSSRLVVLGAYRTSSVALGRRDPASGELSRHPLTGVINELRRARGEIVLELDRADGRAFVEAYVDTEPNRLGAHFRDALYARTGGQALFTVETLRNLQERGELVKDEAGRWVVHETLDWGALPARVDAAIAERIERLPEACRRLLSCASVQGDEFSAEIVAELTGRAAGEVLACLSGTLARQHHLVRAESLSRAEGAQRLRGGQRSTYRFTHHLFQKYLYDQLDPVERAQLHGAVGLALDRQIGGDPVERERLGARLAWHYEAGGLPLPAARALLDAGRQAMRVSAFREALDRLDHGLALLGDEPPSPERTEAAGLLQVARLDPQRNLEGLASSGLQGTLARATEAWACAPGGEAQGRPKLMMLRAETERLLATGQFEDALALAERMRAEATQGGEDGFVGLAHVYFGIIYHFMAQLQESECQFESALASVSPERRAGFRAATGTDLLVSSLALSALNRWFLGYPEQALARSRQAIADARAAGAAMGQAMSTALGAGLLFFLRAGERAMAEQSEECHRLCVEQGLGMWRAFADVILGRLMVMRGDLDGVAGIERMRAAIAAWQARGMVIGFDLFLVLLADSCLLAAGRRPPLPPLRSGEYGGADAVRLLTTGLAALDTVLPLRSALGTIVGPAKVPCGQCYEAELHRLRGELLLARDGLAATGEALDCFSTAIQLGRATGALAWELRATMSLVRLRERSHSPRSEAEWAGEAYAAAESPSGLDRPGSHPGIREREGSQGELAEARRSLRDVYARFTEGFSFPDLQDAAALIGNHSREGMGHLG